MANCQNDFGKLIGRKAVLEIAEGCPDAVPTEAEWRALGALTTKSFDLSPNSVTSEADDTKGFVEGLITNVDFTISGEGEWRKQDKTSDFGPAHMTKYYLDEVKAGRQPSVWVRLSFATVTITAYMNTTAWSAGFPTSEIATYSAEFKVYDADTVDVTNEETVHTSGVTISPTSLRIQVGLAETFTVTVAPTNATNKKFTAMSDNTSVATTSIEANVVTVNGVAEGEANVVIKTDDGDYVAVCDVTVTA